MEKASELTVAKINASVRILEWAKDHIEPGVSGTPVQLHAALSEAFRQIYLSLSDVVREDEARQPKSAPTAAASTPAPSDEEPVTTD